MLFAFFELARNYKSSLGRPHLRVIHVPKYEDPKTP